MRRLMWIAMIVGLGALPVAAAEEGGPPDGGGKRPGRGPGMRGGPGGRMMGPGGGMFDPQARTDVFDAARKTLDLADKARAGVDLLGAQYADELQAAIAQLRARLSKEYVAKILDLLPDDQKPKFEAVAKALAERDEAIATAQKDLKKVLDAVKISQGADKQRREDRRQRFFGPPGGATASKVDILRTHFVLTDQQQEALDAAQREGFDALRERMQALVAAMREAGGAPDPNGFRQVGPAMRQVRDEMDEEVAKVALQFLTDEQKKDYTVACAAIDVSKGKAKDAEEACRTRIVEAVGVERANALLGPPPGKAPEPTRKETTF